MYALTVKQPWAEAIARHGKNVENRSRRPPAHLLGERIAIHVGRASDDWTWMRDGTEPFHDHRHDLYLWAQHGFEHTSARVPDAGRIIATARLVGWIDQSHGGEHYWQEFDIRRVPKGIRNWEDNMQPMMAEWESPWFIGPVGWVLADVRPLLEPVGQLCTWPVPDRAAGDCHGPHSMMVGRIEIGGCGNCGGHGSVPIRGQVYPFQLSPEVEAAVLAAEVRP